MLETANQNGYSLLLRESGDSTDTELKNISALINAHISGIIWEPVSDDSLEFIGEFDKAEVPYLIINYGCEGALNINFRRMGYLATQELIKKGHTEIACLLGEGTRTDAFY